MVFQKTRQYASPLWQDETGIPVKKMLFVFDSDFLSSSLWALISLYEMYVNCLRKRSLLYFFCGLRYGLFWK